MSNQQNYTVSRITWCGIPVEIRHCRNWCAMVGTDHIEVESMDRVPLPITGTGYKSYFIAPERIAEIGTATDYVLAWLEHESQSEAWKRAKAAARQLSLF